MFNNKEADTKTNQRIIDSYDYLANAASTQECTGLIPSAPLNEDELNAYNEIYKYQIKDIPGINK